MHESFNYSVVIKQIKREDNKTKNRAEKCSIVIVAIYENIKTNLPIHYVSSFEQPKS